ncbi:TPA: N-acetyltransferase [Enterococcus faecium]|nr:N-acetyltransferase [Enterococcus faecium]
MDIRTILKDDYDVVDSLTREAFETSNYGYNDEVKLVKRIRSSDSYEPSLEVVATSKDGEILGHGLMSQVEIVNEKGENFVGVTLAPLSVLVSYQGKGIGGKILNELEERAKKLSFQFVSILGDPNYYSKFGYVRASELEIFPSNKIADEVSRIKPLFSNSLNSVHGKLRYSKAFEI